MWATTTHRTRDSRRQSVSYYHAPHKGQWKAECELLPCNTQGTVEGRVWATTMHHTRDNGRQSVSYYHAPHKGQWKAECELIPCNTQGAMEGRVWATTTHHTRDSGGQSVSYYHAPHKGQWRAVCELRTLPHLHTRPDGAIKMRINFLFFVLYLLWNQVFVGIIFHIYREALFVDSRM